ncbi:MAG: WD40-repeat-containing domain protein [Podila humilis]|nr:MAG: WD40-repeat-containing domain protein [Podila humilis]
MAHTPTSFLSGHVAPVLTLDSKDWMLASGSEDRTCRIWDIRSGKVHKALTGFDSSVTTSSFTPVDSHTLYVGSGQKIYTYDLRMEAMILSATESATKVYEGAEDEINQIQVNHRATFLASCDDSGDVRILDLKTHKWMRPLERKHSNIAMSVQFIPKKELQALSGGMDKLVVAWDFYKNRATQQIQTDTPLPDGVSSKQLFNPPFVHSIAVHPSGTRSAVGLGDGTIQFLHMSADPPTPPPVKDGDSLVAQSAPSISKKNKKKSASSGGDGWLLGGRLVEAHSMPIASIEYAGFNPNWLVTSASNGTIAIWDEHATRYECSKQLLQPKAGTTAMEPLPLGRPIAPLTEFRVSNVFERLNYITTSKTTDGEGQRKLFVTGTHPRTGDKKLQGRIAVYHI